MTTSTEALARPRRVLVATLVALGAGCATPRAAEPAAHHVEVKGPLVAPGEAKLGDATSCPVSGDAFVVAADSPHVQYQGTTYYFCCPDCVGDFEKDPAKYLGR
jgi:YHS domain-containing protein